jgi:hypothetical protein
MDPDDDPSPESPGQRRASERPTPKSDRPRSDSPRADSPRSEAPRTDSGRPERSGTIPPPAPEHERRGLFERAVPELVKRVVERAVESGVEKLTELTERPETLRNFVGELRLPKEVLGDVYAQIDDTKNGLYRVVAKEIRDVLQQTQIAEEIVKALTKLSFEIKTEIRFVPNPDAEGEAPAKPKVTTEVTVKDRGQETRKK